MKRNLLFILITSLYFAAIFQINAQEESSLNKKLKSLKGDVKEITIRTSEDELTLSDEDAEKLFKRIQMTSGDFEYEFITSDSNDEKIFKIKLDGIESDSSKNIMVFVSEDEDFEWNEKGEVEKDINIEIIDGVKKVTIRTEKDGKETVEILHGEEADNYLEEHNGKTFEIKINDEKANKRKVIIKTIKEKKEK